ncbi:MAG TPA: TRAP transporter small permease subunit [Gammaproteobacteria bacterium]|nr:TRAP transporter small permease subunit [Gammaproteobacteria bacterium]
MLQLVYTRQAFRIAPFFTALDTHPLSHRSPLINWIETIAEWVGRSVSWLVLAMVLLIAYDVAMRYLFQAGSVALQELEWHLFALLFLLGAAYTFKHDGHVRVDIFYHSRRVSDRGRAWIDLLGGVFLLIPFCLLIIVSSYPFVETAFAMHEGSPDPGGLPYRFLLKATIPLAFGLLLLQGIAHILRSAQILLGKHKAAATDNDEAQA